MKNVPANLRAAYPDFDWDNESEPSDHPDWLGQRLDDHVKRGGRFISQVKQAILATQTYKEALTQQMLLFGEHRDARFVGYGLLDGKGANGTLKNIPNEKICECTVAENLMVGIAHGFALTGLRPLVFFERADFIACGLSAISNHLDVARQISKGEFNPCVIIRAVIGNSRKPLFTGPTHTSNPTAALKHYLHMPVYEVKTPDEVTAAYERAIYEQAEGIGSSFILEHKDLL